MGFRLPKPPDHEDCFGWTECPCSCHKPDSNMMHDPACCSYHGWLSKDEVERKEIRRQINKALMEAYRENIRKNPEKWRVVSSIGCWNEPPLEETQKDSGEDLMRKFRL